jgi:ABC-type transporter Mla subunit MlaD
MTSDLLTRPELRGILADSDRISRSTERFAGVAEGLPGALAREREALINQLSNVLVAQEETLRPMLVELRQALEAANTTATSVDAVVKSLDALMARRPAGSAEPPDAEPAKPFDITEYTTAAAEFTRTATELRQLLTALDSTAPALASTLGSTVDQGRSLVNHVALMLAALILLLIGGTFASALAYRSLTARTKS